MDYALAIENTPETVPAGSSILLVHPSTGETDRIDTEFLATDTDQFLVVSSRTTAREVKQKLEYYEVSEADATILDTLSVERGYTRRQWPNVRYVSEPGDWEGILAEIERFLAETEGKRRVSFDSLTELIYYSDEDAGVATAERLVALLATHDAVGLVHLASGVHDDATIERIRALFDGVVELHEDGTVSSSFEGE
jgi:KaiC/GvpD/RAD55 family RecA-like ATPase